MSDNPVILDDITERELEILALLKERLTNQEIADRLFLATSTIKWYIKQLNSKLDTNNRYEIVEQAEQLGLLQQADEPAPLPDKFQRQQHNLPRQTTHFIGRDDEIDELHSILSNPDIRLLTILAPGGMGKTRIALELAEQQLSEYEDGVYHVSLQSIETPSQLLPQIAVSLGFRLNNDQLSPEKQVLNFLSNKKILLLLDNFEHVLDASELVNEILVAAPHINILVTSRERLNLLAETIYPLQGMKLPAWDSVEDARSYDAVQLLVQTAQRIQPDWELTSENLETVAGICQFTGGMPLGILLAVSWLDIYSLEQIYEQIQQDVDILETEMRDIPERQRSIRAVFNYSWEHLKARERDVLMRLSIFRSGCTLDAAQAIAGASPRVLHNLLNKALINVDKDERYSLHKLLRQYAELKLADALDRDSIYDTHLAYYASILAREQAALYTKDEPALLQMVERDFDNLRLAWIHAIQSEQWQHLVHLIQPVQQYLLVFGNHAQGIELFQPLVDTIPQWDNPSNKQFPVMIEFIYATKFMMQANLIDSDVLEAIQVRGLALAREKEDKAAILKCLRAIIKLIRHPDRAEETERLLSEAIDLARETNDKKILAKLLLNAALIAYDFHTDRAASLEINQEVIALTRKTGDQRRLSKALSNAAVTQLADGNWASIQQSLEAAESIARQIGDIQSLLFNLAIQRDLALYQMQLDAATTLQNELARIEEVLNVPWREFTHNYRQFFWLFLQEDYQQGLVLWEETQNIAMEQQPYPLTNIAHGAMFAGMLGDADRYLADVKSNLESALKWQDTPRAIYQSIPMLHILYEREGYSDCIILLSGIHHNPNTWQLVLQHPYLEMKAKLEREIDDAIFDVAWEQGASLNMREHIQALHSALYT